MVTVTRSPLIQRVTFLVGLMTFLSVVRLPFAAVVMTALLRIALQQSSETAKTIGGRKWACDGQLDGRWP